MTSQRFPLPATRKLGLLTLALLLVAALATAPEPAQAASCHAWTEYYEYYSDASKTVQVGWCEFACYCQTYCEGDQTPYYRKWLWPGCL